MSRDTSAAARLISRRLDQRVAIVVGAGSVGPGWGNGKATAVLFAREGAQVMCVDIDGAAAEDTADLIRGEGGSAIACQADASNAEAIRGAVATCVDRFGTIDILDNNVGVLEAGDVVELDEAIWDRVVAVNLKSCFLTMKHVIPVMVRGGGGSIVNISSMGSIRHTGVRSASYYSTKAAMNQLTRTTAVEYGPLGIRVNAVLPGLIDTPMVTAAREAFADGSPGDDPQAASRARAERIGQCPLRRMGDAWDVARAAVFLASDDARYITGAELPVDGGITVRCL